MDINKSLNKSEILLQDANTRTLRALHLTRKPLITEDDLYDANAALEQARASILKAALNSLQIISKLQDQELGVTDSTTINIINYLKTF